MGERVTVEGTVENVIFHNEENGYTVLLLTVEGEEEPVTVVGCIPCAAAGEGMTVTGVWSVHPVHGSQLTAESVERRMPEREEDMIAYLSSGILKGVGPATAQRLVERFGADTLLVIEREPERLRCIKGITAQRAKELSDAFRALTGLRQLMEFLARYDLPVYLAMPLQRTYGDGAIQALRDDPYILSRAQYGVDFSTVDEIAISLGFGGDDPCRLRAALTYELEHNAANGHVFLPREKLLFATSQLLAVTPDELELALDKLIEGFGVVEKTIAGVQGCYLPRLYQAETFVAERLLSLVRTPVEVLPRAEKVIDDIEKEQGVAYAPLQRQAVCLAAQGGILLLTGGPGTGKTTSLRGIVSLYERMGLDVALLAPTGRAAKRLGEVTGREAQTIHRALGMSYNELTGQTAFKKNAQDPLEVHAVIVDEMSMVDIELMRSLLEAMRPGSRLVLVGDPDQLPSVGPGSVLGDMLRSGVVPAVLYHLALSRGFSDIRILRALATAGLIGNIVKQNASISGAEAGCQAEVGVACSMASAAANQLFGGSPSQIEYAAEMGLEHHLGMTCDPVCGLVQIPCIERNAYAAARALDANLYSSFTDGGHRVSFDKVVEVMKETGNDLPSLYKETSEGGLAKDFRPM